MTASTVESSLYSEELLSTLVMVWGEGYMSPGGPDAVREIVSGIDMSGKTVVDVGCGLGGIAEFIAQEYDCRVTGLDVDALLIQRASASAERARLSDQIDYKLIEPGPLPLTEGSCDVVFGKESWLFIEDRPGFFAEAFRVLRPGGFLVGSDWTSNGQPPSDNLLRYYELRGAEYDLKTEAWYADHLEQAGFTRVTTVDATDSASTILRNDYERMRGPLREALVDTLQPEGYERFLELWRLISTMMTNKELRTVIARGQRGGCEG